LGPHLTRGVFLHVAARQLPLAPKLRQAGLDVDSRLRVGVGAGRVIDAHRRFPTGSFQIDLAHGHLKRPDVDLAAATDRARGYANFELGIDVGHASLSISEGERVSASLPTPV